MECKLTSICAVLSRNPIPLREHLVRMIECLCLPGEAPVSGCVGDVPFRGRMGRVSVPDSISTSAIAQVGGDPHPDIIMDSPTFRPEGLEMSRSFLSNWPTKISGSAPLFGSAIVSSTGSLAVCRDPLGTRPLFMSRGEVMAFASEPASLQNIELGPIEAFPPAQLLMPESGAHIPLRMRIPREYSKVDKRVVLPKLVEALHDSIKSLPFPRALFFSGGIDSLVLAKVCEELDDTILITAGLEGCKDIERAKEAASSLSTPLEIVIISVEGMTEDIDLLSRMLANTDPMNLAVALPILHAAKRARELGFKIAVAGQGADELFGGYHRYLSDPYPSASMLKDLTDLHSRGMDSFHLATRSQGLDLHLPYLDETFLQSAISMPQDQKIGGGIRKLVLREIGLELGLNEQDVATRKRAIQYGSGVNKHVIKALKEREPR